jgi:predicted DNA-binding transcriptional regulator YafY
VSDKLERLLNLTAALLESSRHLTAGDIKQRVPGYPDGDGAFRRAFERDKADLREMGIPLSVEEIILGELPEQGYRIPKDQYYIRDPGLEPDELAALHLAASAVRLDGVEGAGGLWKLGGVPLSTKARNRMARETGELAAIPADERLVSFFRAVAEQRPTTFDYRDNRRTVDPYRLDFQRGRWYVTGYDHLREGERHFRLDRVAGDVELGERRSFVRPQTEVPGARLEPWQLGEGEPVHGRVLVDADQAAIALAAVGPEAVVEEHADGSIVLELSVTNPDGFRSFVLGFLERAEVLGPPALRDDVITWLEALVVQQ